MTFPVWSEEYAVGVPVMDQQHAVLFSAIHSICQAYESGADNDGLKEPFDFLMEYTRFHFKTEERLMEVLGFPELDRHRKEHHHLFDEVTRLMFRARTQDVVIRTEVLPPIKCWLLDHIQGMDLTFAEFYICAESEGRFDPSKFDLSKI